MKKTKMSKNIYNASNQSLWFSFAIGEIAEINGQASARNGGWRPSLNKVPIGRAFERSIFMMNNTLNPF